MSQSNFDVIKMLIGELHLAKKQPSTDEKTFIPSPLFMHSMC